MESGTGHDTFANSLTRKFHTNTQWRSRFELRDHYVVAAVQSPVPEHAVEGLGNDRLEGGGDDDILMGQQGSDFLAIDPGQDTRYGGTGVDHVSFAGLCQGNEEADCDDPNLTLADGADRPDHAELEALKAGVLAVQPGGDFAARWSTEIVKDTLDDTIYTPGHPVATNQISLGWTTSDESFEVREYRVARNADEPHDVDGNGLVTPLDVLLGINKLNSQRSNLPVAGGLGTFSSVYLDVNGDGLLTPLDTLMIIDLLNREASGGEGEAHSPAPSIHRHDPGFSINSVDPIEAASVQEVVLQDWGRLEGVFPSVITHERTFQVDRVQWDELDFELPWARDGEPGCLL
ncbi:MAG: dockerin type I domain-containing protein [Planctomycetota bacterium]|nr:dockerin type I domain-containing protein [Planctomycetota bacterium]